MMRLKLIGILTLTILAAPSYSETPAADRTKQIDAIINTHVKTDTPGLSISVYHKGDQYTRGYGMADLEQNVPIKPETIFHVASVSKQFTAFAIALLETEGKLDLDAPVQRYLPYVPDFGDTITVRHLLHHTSGLRDVWYMFLLAGKLRGDEYSQSQIINLVKRQRALNFKPGTQHLYCNTGYVLLSEIVRAVSGKSFRDFTNERIFIPLGMTQSFFLDNVREIIPQRAQSYNRSEDGKHWERAILSFGVVGTTNLQTTPADLIKWTRNFSEPKVGSKTLIDRLSQPSKLNDGTSVNYGFGLERQVRFGHATIEHAGGDAGFLSYVILVPQADFSIALASNTQDVPLSDIASDVIKTILGTGPIPEKLGEPKTVPGELAQALKGRYANESDKILSLFSDTDGDPEPLFLRADGSLDFGEPQWFSLQPRRGADGRFIGIDQNVEGRQTFLARIDNEAPKLSVEELSDFAGQYRSKELDITYDFIVKDGKLTTGVLWQQEPDVLAIVAPDRFENENGSSALATIKFTRDQNGMLTGAKLYTERALGIQLDRILDRPVQ